MSCLIFVERWKLLYLTTPHDGHLKELGHWPAHNRVAKKAKGPWPQGIFKWLRYSPHVQEGYWPASLVDTYGGCGIHIFEVKGRAGMGVHAGRSKTPDEPGWNTLGCIRTTADAMAQINLTHRTDKLTHIAVFKESVKQAHIAVQVAMGTSTPV